MVVIGLLSFPLHARTNLLVTGDPREQLKAARTHLQRRDVVDEHPHSSGSGLEAGVESRDYDAMERELLRRRAKRVTGTNRSRMEGVNGDRNVRIAAVCRDERDRMGCPETLVIIVVVVVDVGVG
jgi:hypothetical protein